MHKPIMAAAALLLASTTAFAGSDAIDNGHLLIKPAKNFQLTTGQNSREIPRAVKTSAGRVCMPPG